MRIEAFKTAASEPVTIACPFASLLRLLCLCIPFAPLLRLLSVWPGLGRVRAEATTMLPAAAVPVVAVVAVVAA